MGSAVCFYLSESTRILLSDKFGWQKSNWQRWMSRVLRYVYCVCFILKGTKFKKKINYQRQKLDKDTGKVCQDVLTLM